MPTLVINGSPTMFARHQGVPFGWEMGGFGSILPRMNYRSRTVRHDSSRSDDGDAVATRRERFAFKMCRRVHRGGRCRTMWGSARPW